MHILSRLGITLGLVFAFALTGSAAEKKAKAPHGIVQSVEKDILTVEVVQGKKGQQTTTEEKFTLTNDTKYERITKIKGQKGKAEKSEASRGDLIAGARVAVILNGGAVQKVVLLGKGKKK